MSETDSIDRSGRPAAVNSVMKVPGTAYQDYDKEADDHQAETTLQATFGTHFHKPVGHPFIGPLRLTFFGRLCHFPGHKLTERRYL